MIVAAVVASAFVSPRGWAWGPDGHQIVALIAADHLSPVARRHIAKILGVADNSQAVADAMARAALRPDLVYRSSAPETIPWHYINLCRQDVRADEAARCPNGNCIVAKIDQFVTDLHSDTDDQRWTPADQLAFVINFMGEIHQPLHTITNADMGGMCVGVIAPEHANALHSLWGETLVGHVERELHTSGPPATAAALERRFPQSAVELPPIADIAWESHQLAEQDVYRALSIPLRPCQPTACIKPAHALRINQAYIDREWNVVARRLAIGGYRLAALLNSIWTV